MKFQTVFLCLSLTLHFNSYPMNPSRELDSKTKQIALVQTIYEALGNQKNTLESLSLITEAQELDAIKAQTKGNSYKQMYAPWRDTYKKELAQSSAAPSSTTAPTAISASAQQERPCPFCKQFSQPNDDKKNYILERNQHSVVMFNRSPYTPLHFLILPYKHIAKMSAVSPEARQELFESAQRWVKKLERLGIDNAHLFFNLEDKCAGASLPGHLHCQLLFRVPGDESALASRLGEDIVTAERNALLDSFYGITDNAFSQKELLLNTSQTLPEQTLPETSIFEKSLDTLVSVYGPYKQLLASLQSNHENSASNNCTQTASQSNSCYACLLKNYKDDETDNKHLVVKRFAHWVLLLNRFGYIGGDSLLITKAHDNSFANLRQEELSELTTLLPLIQEKLNTCITAPGLNIGCNIGSYAGNNFQGHTCFKIMPRTPIDTAAITTCCDTVVIDKNLPNLCERLTKEFEELRDESPSNLTQTLPAALSTKTLPLSLPENK